MHDETANDLTRTVLAGGGELGALIRVHDWSRMPLGPVDSWPQSLRSVVSMLLPSKAQIIPFWGPEFTVLYNDAYRPVFGAKHPRALGLPGREVWSEIWDEMLHDLLAGVVRTGEAFWAKDLLFVIERTASSRKSTSTCRTTPCVSSLAPSATCIASLRKQPSLALPAWHISFAVVAV